MVLLVETDNMKRTLQMIQPLVKSETSILANGARKDYIIEAGDWTHLKKRGK